MSTAIKEINGIKYALDSSDCTATVVRQDKLSMTEIVIPSYVKSLFKKYKVTRVDDEAFSGLAVKRLIIECDIGYIGSRAFAECGELTSVVMGSGGKYIGDEAFVECAKLESVEIRSGVTDIGERAFSHCGKLTSVELPDTLTELSTDVFYGCGLTQLFIPASVKRICDDACASCYSLTEVKLLEGLERIGNCAFSNCQRLSKLNIPRSVTSIGNCAFNGSDQLMSVEDCVGYVDKWAVLFFRWNYRYGSITLRSNTVGIADNVFEEYDFEDNRLDGINIPNGVKYIGIAEFSECKNFMGVILPESVIAMGARVFNGCNTLSRVNIPNKVTEIGDYTFKDCKALGSIKIPDGVKRIGAGAFMDCTGITEIRIPESVTEIGENAFSGCTALTINCEAESELSGWNEDWNNSMRPVNWNVNADGAIDKAKS